MWQRSHKREREREREREKSRGFKTRTRHTRALKERGRVLTYKDNTSEEKSRALKTHALSRKRERAPTTVKGRTSTGGAKDMMKGETQTRERRKRQAEHVSLASSPLPLWAQVHDKETYTAHETCKSRLRNGLLPQPPQSHQQVCARVFSSFLFCPFLPHLPQQQTNTHTAHTITLLSTLPCAYTHASSTHHEQHQKEQPHPSLLLCRIRIRIRDSLVFPPIKVDMFSDQSPGGSNPACHLLSLGTCGSLRTPGGTEIRVIMFTSCSSSAVQGAANAFSALLGWLPFLLSFLKAVHAFLLHLFLPSHGSAASSLVGCPPRLCLQTSPGGPPPSRGLEAVSLLGATMEVVPQWKESQRQSRQLLSQVLPPDQRSRWHTSESQTRSPHCHTWRRRPHGSRRSGVQGHRGQLCHLC